MEAVVNMDRALVWRGRVLRCALGEGGIRDNKQEGDGATPSGLLPLRRLLYRADRLRPPTCSVPVEPIAASDAWCDDPASVDYNRLVRLPFDATREELWRRDELYDVIGVLGWNDNPVVRGRGSAIFLHVARSDFAPTRGCVALALSDLIRILEEGLTGISIPPG
jgi:L,D-peptidoglycan transpeptidase YkuD (ErfK/YbiS/YcfS/YnhG family)